MSKVSISIALQQRCERKVGLPVPLDEPHKLRGFFDELAVELRYVRTSADNTLDKVFVCIFRTSGMVAVWS